jgi:hypothetical protein
MTRRAAVIVALAASLLLASCTFVPTDSAPQAITKHPPFGLSSGTLPRGPKPANYVTRSVWLINADQQLASRPRRVPESNSVAVSLEALFAGPTDHESALGFTSEVPATLNVIGIGSLQGITYVRLNGPITYTGTPASALESGQLVLTAGAVSDQFVEILVNSRPLQLTTPDGFVQLLVRPTDYSSLMAR